ncbi:MAG: ATPase [Eubacterium sp.]|nr:ATPase [Eubacterium sp.]
MTVLDLLEEIEDIVETASTVPLTNKIMIEGDELLDIVKEIRESLPDDVQQAKWVRDEKDRILAEAKSEYEKIIVEANKQADYLVEEHDITRRAKQRAVDIETQAEDYAKVLKLKTYDYLDKILYDMQGRFDELNGKYLNELFNYMSKTFENMGGVLQNNRDELKQMAYQTKNGEDQ